MMKMSKSSGFGVAYSEIYFHIPLTHLGPLGHCPTFSEIAKYFNRSPISLRNYNICPCLLLKNLISIQISNSEYGI